MILELACPCGLPRPYSSCCGSLHCGERTAVTAEELMRSRYAAFCRREADYLIRTWHPQARAGLDRRSLAADDGLAWVGLKILETVAGGPHDETGLVEFEARYVASGRSGAMRERSRFCRVDGEWVYQDAVPPTIKPPRTPRSRRG